jgi:putative copper resistance protein D
MLRAAQLLLPALAAGLLGLRLLLPDRLDDCTRARLGRIAGGALALCVVAAGLMLAGHARMLLPDEPLSERMGAALTTWIGRVLVAQALCAALALVSLAIGGWTRVAAGLALAAAAGGALRGHVIASGDGGVLDIAAVVHLALATLWVAGLGALVTCRALEARGRFGGRWRDVLQAFSPWALRGMVLLLATGVMLADRTVASGAALLATPYGHWLLAKLGCIVAALFCAGRLRRWLARGTSADHGRAAAWLALESALCVLIVAAAVEVATTIPAAHDVIDWPFPFRIAPTAAWLQSRWTALWPALLAPIPATTGALLAWRRRHRSAWQAGAIATTGLVAGIALAVPALSVDAYPTTYLHSPVPYDTGSVTAGARLYRQWCVDCHGLQGRGDGPLAGQLPVRAANLTEPHVQWHTHGDLYWWLSEGMGRSGMPGFRDRLSADERWQLLNYLSALSLGHEARPVTGRIIPNDPWLPAIDLRHADTTNELRSLAGWRRQEQPVLLAFADDPAQARRLGALADARTQAGVQAVAVLSPAAATSARPPGWDAVVDETGDVAAAWALYRRTLEDPDFDDERVSAGGLLFLIDRFGFVRARWTATTPLPGVDEVAAMVAGLAREPRIRDADIHGPR